MSHKMGHRWPAPKATGDKMTRWEMYQAIALFALEAAEQDPTAYVRFRNEKKGVTFEISRLVSTGKARIQTTVTKFELKQLSNLAVWARDAVAQMLQYLDEMGASSQPPSSNVEAKQKTAQPAENAEQQP